LNLANELKYIEKPYMKQKTSWKASSGFSQNPSTVRKKQMNTKFRTVDLVGVIPGEAVPLTVRGYFYDGFYSKALTLSG